MSPETRADGYRIASLHFVFFFGIGAFIPYMTLFLSQVLVRPDGSPANNLIGLMVFLNQALGMLGAPVAGIFADRYRLDSGVLTICALAGVAGATVLAIPAFLSDAPFWLLTGLVAVGIMAAGFFSRPIPSLIDTRTLKFLQDTIGDVSEYGRYRVFGSVGFIIAAVGIGILLAATGMIGLTVVLHGMAFLAVALVAHGKMPAQLQRIRIPWHHLKDNRPFRHFVLFTFISSMAIYSAFLFTGYFLDDINAGYIVMGLVFGVSALPELPVMLKAGALARRFGLKGIICIGLVAQMIKLLLFVVLAGTPAAWTFILASSLHGVGYALIHIGSIRMTDDFAHPDMRATYQNIQQITRAAGIAVGGPLSGIVLDLWDSRVLMAICAALVGLSLLYFLFFVRESEA